MIALPSLPQDARPWCTCAAHPRLPIGVQLIAASWREDQVLRVAAELERAGLCYAPVA